MRVDKRARVAKRKGRLRLAVVKLSSGTQSVSFRIESCRPSGSQDLAFSERNDRSLAFDFAARTIRVLDEIFSTALDSEQELAGHREVAELEQDERQERVPW